MLKRFKPLTPTVVLLFLAAVGIWRTFYFPKSQAQRYLFGPGFWPRLIGIFLVTATLFHITIRIKKVWLGANSSSDPKKNTDEKSLKEGDPNSSESAEEGKSQLWRVLPGIVVAVTYVYLIPRLGFFIITPLFLVGFMLLLGARDLLKIIFATGLLEGFMLLIFVRFLYLPVPAGTIPVFRHANVVLMNLVS